MNHCRFLLSVAQYGLFGLEMCCHNLHTEKKLDLQSDHLTVYSPTFPVEVVI